MDCFAGGSRERIPDEPNPVGSVAFDGLSLTDKVLQPVAISPSVFDGLTLTDKDSVVRSTDELEHQKRIGSCLSFYFFILNLSC